jgi:hypothetical protein
MRSSTEDKQHRGVSAYRVHQWATILAQVSDIWECKATRKSGMQDRVCNGSSNQNKMKKAAITKNVTYGI